MTSERNPDEAFVWVWLPGSEEPVVAGRVEEIGDIVTFNYGQSYLQRDDAIALYEPELPLRAGELLPLDGLRMAGCIADAAPDAWGRRVIMHRLLGAGTEDPDALSTLTYLLTSGSDRIGAFDFQLAAERYEGRGPSGAPLEELTEAVARFEAGEPFSPALDQALLHGSSVGGARPKALLEDGDRKLIAKFSSTTDPYPVVKGEFAAMELARRAGLDVARVDLTHALAKDVLLVERFDRISGAKSRRVMVSALTALQLDEMNARYASYADLAQRIREAFTEARRTLHELFGRITFNILVGNTDDHARNHAAFWDGRMLTLTPAYDICPQSRAGDEATQAMQIGPDGFRMSQLTGCVRAASTYQLSDTEARAIIDAQIEAIHSEWDAVCDLARMTVADRRTFAGRSIFNPYSFYDYCDPPRL